MAVQRTAIRSLEKYYCSCHRRNY